MSRAAVAGAGERAARVAWTRVAEPADPEVAALVAEHGHAGALALVREGRAGRPGQRDRALRVDPDREAAHARRLGARILVPGDEEWPPALDDLAVPPHAMWVRGTGVLDALTRRAVSVVGARAATAYGAGQARSLGFGLAERGFTVVSGAAFGIDAAAHEGALAGAGPTVALLACGVERDYPAAHAPLLARVREAGLVVSELPPGSAPLRLRFLARNRLIAALGAGTVVVEAGLRSGSLNTARHAQALSRVVCAVPGPVTSAVSAGCHQLLREQGAVLVTDADEVADAVGALGDDLAPVRHEEHLDEEWTPTDRLVFDAVTVGRGRPVDRIVADTGCAPLAVLASLTRLEDAGAVRCGDHGWQKQAVAARGTAAQAPAAHPVG